MKRFVIALVSATLGVGVWARQAPPAQQPPFVPQFRTTVDLVHLDVSVLDKSRRPVRGLTAADFTVLENGKPQQVSAFSAVDVPNPAPAPAPWVREVAPDVRGNSDVQQRRLFVLAIDDATIENNPFAIKSVKTIARSVVDRLGPSDLASVVFTADNRHAQDFTSDRARLLAAVDSFNGGARGMGSPGQPGDMDDMWFLNSVSVLERAVDFLSDVPERRKSIIYIGQGLPFSPEVAGAPVSASRNQTAGAVSSSELQMRIKDQLNDIFDLAQRSNVTVYTVDACGQRVPQPPPPPAPTCVPGVELDYLVNVAAATGGRPVVNSNDFEPGLTAVFQENSSYYLLGYQSADPVKDGKFRTVEVKVNRPDVDVRTRSGYDAPREQSTDRPRAAPSPLMRALAGVVPKSDLPMQVTAAPFAVAGKPDAAVAIAVGFRQPIRQAGERFVESVDLQISAFDADGRSFGNSRSRADVTIRAGASGPAEYEVFGQIALKPGRYQLRIAADVASLATTGSVYFDVDVPDFAKAPVSLSGLLVSASPSPPFAPKDALKAVVPVIPTTRRVFSASHAVSVFGRVYQGGRAKPVAVTARMQIRDTTNAVVIDRPLEIGAGRFGKARAADVRFDVPVKELPPGAYVLTIETSVGATTARRDARFQVVR